MYSKENLFLLFIGKVAASTNYDSDLDLARQKKNKEPDLDPDF